MNLNYLFYNEYFNFLVDSHAKKPTEIDKAIVHMQVSEQAGEDIPCNSFCMQTTYPGLLFGVGNAHDVSNLQVENAKSAIKIGFTFDYVTGLPVIPGSSIKGVLRSAFSNHPEYVLDCLGWEENEENKTIIGEIEKLIFGDKKDIDTRVQDTFLPAVPIKAGKGNRLIGEDYVTSHKAENERYNGLIEPNPVKMLKVIPEVVYKFRFLLKDTVFSSGNGSITLSVEQKLKLFQQIIEDLSVGAKTNVGYGVMIPVTDVDENKILVLGEPQFTDPQLEKKKKDSVQKGEMETKICANPGCNNKVTKNKQTGKWNRLCYSCFSKGRK